MNYDEKLAFGIEIVSAMKASAYNCSIVDGRILALDNTELNLVEGIDYDNCTDGEKLLCETVSSREKENLHKQALFVADYALNFINEMSARETNKQEKEAYEAVVEYQKETNDKNTSLIMSIGATSEDVGILLDGCFATGIMQIVDAPMGCEDENNTKFFKRVFIEQWGNAMECDSFAGNIYAEFADHKWLMISYEC